MNEFDYTAVVTRNLFEPGQAIVHIAYRRRGSRSAWTRFHLVPDEGESFESVAAKIEPAIAAHAEQR